MQLSNYINDLLYRYDCVIVPNFGGFVTNKISATVDNSHTFYPPTKLIGFNSYLKHNDGLLTNYIAAAEKISFKQASEKIEITIADWQETLKTSSVEVLGVGVLSLNTENQLIFEPNTTTNFLTESFGLNSVTSSVVERFKEKEEVKIIPIEKVTEETSKKSIPAFVKYAASVAILLALGVVGFNAINKYNSEEILAKQQQEIEKKIQKATFVIDTPLPAINLNIEKEDTKHIHIIAGAFQFAENAEIKVAELQEKGFDAKILGKNKWNLIQVSCGSFSDETKARETLQKVKNEGSKDAWLFIK